MVKSDSPLASAADIYMEEQMRSIFQWEKSSGLEHSCYACNTKSNSPKALQTCYGIHSIPCSRYHQTMHAIGTSHNCDACIKADSLHDCRHRKIAELLAEYRSLVDVEPQSTKRNKKATPAVPTTPTPLRERDVNAVTSPTPIPFNLNTTPQAAINRRAARDLTLDVENINLHADDDIDNDNDHDTSTISSSASTTTTTPKLSKAEVRASKRAAKQAKSEQKSLKNQSKHPVIVRSSDVSHVHFVLHGDTAVERTGNPNSPTPSTPGTAATSIGDEEGAGAEPVSRHPLATDTAIEDVLQRNIGYVTHIKEHKAYLLRTVAGKTRSERAMRVKKEKARVVPVTYDEDGVAVFEEEMDEDVEALVDAVLGKLGVEVPASPTGVAGTGKRERVSSGSSTGSTGGSGLAGQKGALLARLRVEIGEDIKKHENEQRMTCIRAGGFWRYVGKGVFERMMRLGKGRDWRTGVILKETVGVVGEAGEEGGEEEV